MQLLLAAEAGAPPPFLVETTALVVGAAVVAYVGSRLGLVPIVGFLLAGVLIGPEQLGLVESIETVEQVAEVGVILLLFTIGLEFSVERLLSMWRLIAFGGGAQVGLAILVTAGIALGLGVAPAEAVFTGMLVALSSTAIVFKLLADRREMSDPHGRAGVGMLLFQDLAVVLMVVVVPLLGGDGGSGLEVARALAVAAVVVLGVVALARALLPRLLDSVARQCSPEVFLLVVLGVCVGTAYVTSLAGVSVSLGAFLAGLIVSETKVSEYALSEVLSIQVVFVAVFFVSVGMLLDVGFVLSNLPLVLGVVAAVVVIKWATAFVALVGLRQRTSVAGGAALLLAQIGEFSFVLEVAGRDAGLSPAGLGDDGTQLFYAASVLLLVASPFLARTGALVAARGPAADEERVAEQTTEPVEASEHVVIAGYGRMARALITELDRARIATVVVTLSPEALEEATAEGRVAVLGDASKRHALDLARVGQARAVLVPDDETEQAVRIAGVVHALAPHVPVIARALEEGAVEALTEAGATDAVSDARLVAQGLLRELLDRLAVAREETDRLVADLATQPLGRVGEGPRTAARERTVESIDLDTAVHFAGADACEHLAEPQDALPSAAGCEECLAKGERQWVHLRICLSCGHVGCCDSSPGRHASMHHRVSDHPTMTSLEPGETWAWCFEDEVEADPARV